ncbi:hypothetical protein [Tsukamurella ocularis]|uniref:hypothetical protein n=1 Tax=Tsukamurella ocularis TaxID=1970234 RepID=UPI002169FFB3|nr:hypothetical protein [Tsukamurella ocularis]MCS3780983.1 hypothetical protein [Tsukamurella ocularis]MCS3786807.1 hypothetical protein [Tsukamurella ocularis]MCS3850649.1 hypothetical protein [Tsukamurella ocularis]
MSVASPSALPASRRVLWIGATVLIVGQLAVRGYVLARGNFYWDDVAFIGRASRPLTDLGAWFVDYDGHFMPGTLFAAAVTTKVAPLSWPAAAASILLLQLLASVLTLRTLVIVAGRRPVVLVPFVFLLFSPLTLTATAWWASALNALPLQIGLAVVVAEAVRYLRGRRRSGLYAVAALLASLLFFEKALVIPFVALAAACLLPYVRGHRRPVRTVLHRGRGLWAAFALVVVAWVVLWLSVTASRPGTHTVGFTARVLWRSVNAVLAPATVGGPWTWRRENPGPPLVVTDATITVVGLVAIVAIVAVTWWRAPRGLAAWGAAGAYFLGASSTVFFLRSSEYTSALLPLSLRYFADVAWVLTLAAAIVLRCETGRFRGREAESGLVRWKSAGFTSDRRLWAAVVIVFALSGTVSAVRFAPLWHDNPTGPYLQNLRAGAAAYADREVLDQEVHGDILARLAGPNNRLSRILATQPAHPRFAEYAGEATVVDQQGRFRPGQVTRVRSLPLGPFPCGTRVDDTTPSTLAYEGPLAFWDWVVQFNYLASSDGVIVLQQQRGATPVRVPIRRGAHTVYARVAGTGEGLIARAETPGLVACVGSGPVGLLVPASL